MPKQTIIISNAWEAAEIMLLVMNQQDKVRAERNQAAVKAANAIRQCQYAHYSCRVTLLDNELVKLYRLADAIAEYLIMPQ